MTNSKSIQTQGGLYAEGDVTSGRDFIGGNQINITVERADNALEAENLTQARETYLQWLIDGNEYLETHRPVALKLDEIYISLQAQHEEKPNDVDRRLQQREWDELRMRLAQSQLSAEEQEDRLDILLYDFEQKRRRAESANFDEESEEDDRRPRIPQPAPPIPLAQATAQHERLVILGDPGCGKTTLLRYLACQHAQAIQASESHVHLVNDGSDGSAGGSQQPALFPILIRVADYVENHKRMPLNDFLRQYLHDNEREGKSMGRLFLSELAQGGCLMLLDGLDEIVSADDRRDIVKRIKNFVLSHAKGGVRGINRFIITSRIAGYRSAPISSVSGEPFAYYVVEEMNDNQIKRFLARWCRVVAEAQRSDDIQVTDLATAAQQEADSLLEAINANPGARRLAGNPLMLRTLALIHSEKETLPKKRVELYKLATGTLAHTWRKAQGVSESVLLKERNLTFLLGQLAYWIHVHKPTGIATKEEVYEQLGAALAKRQRIDWDPDEPDLTVMDEIDNFLLIVREHTGLFVERAPNRYGFMHLTFEEYYAARHLVAHKKKRAKLIRSHLHDPRWEEPILLALGFVGLDAPSEARQLFETVILVQSAEAEKLEFSPSQYEELLGRDNLFALRCLGDQVPANLAMLDNLMGRLADELLHKQGLARFSSYNARLHQILPLLKGSPAAELLMPKLLTGFQNDDGYVRSRAADSLGKIGEANGKILTALVTVHKDEDSSVRSSIVASLGKLGEDSDEIITILVAALRDDDGYVRSCAVDSLKKLGKTSSKAIIALIAALRDDHRNVRFLAALAINEVSEANSEVTTVLIEELIDDEIFASDSAVATLKEIGAVNNEVITALIEDILDDAFVEYDSTIPILEEGLDSNEIITNLITALSDEVVFVRTRAAATLGELGIPSREALTALIAALKDDTWDVRKSAVVSLGKLRDASSEVLTALIVALMDDHSDVRSRAAASLGELGEGSSEVSTSLITALKDKHSFVRDSAATSLGKLGEVRDEVSTALIAALKDDYSFVRSSAAASLGEVGEASSEVTAALIVALKDDDGSVRFYAAASLGIVGKSNSEVITALIAALKDEDIFVRDNAAASLGKLGQANSEVIDALITALNDDERDVYSRAAASLGELGKINRDETITALISFIHDSDYKVGFGERTDQAYGALWKIVVG